MAAALLVLTLTVLLVGVTQSRYGDPYPVSGSWFKDRPDRTTVGNTLSEFASIGGDTVLLRGAEFLNRTAESIVADSEYLRCRVAGKHCVDVAKEELSAKGLDIQAWVTYSYNEDYSNQFATCKGFDKMVLIGFLEYSRTVLWLEDSRAADDCSFTNGSRVAVLFSVYSGEGDPHALLLEQAQPRNMSVYLGLPKPPYISEDQESSSLINAFFQFNYRVIEDHKRRFSKYSVMKGYYSDVHVITDYIVNVQKNISTHDRLPAQFVVIYWRELYFLAGNFGYEVIGSPSIDLTHASNTTLKGYMDGMKGIAFYSQLAKYVIRDGRGDGKAAYFREEQKNATIFGTDHSLYELLKYKNSSITEKTTFADVYYASIADFFRAYAEIGIPVTWLMMEAYDDIQSGSTCAPVDPKQSGMSRPVHSVYKHRLDQALTHVGSMVQKATAFAWDPLFTCNANGKNLTEQIRVDYKRPIISECRFHSAANQSIVVIGFNIDGPPTQSFQVNYTLYDGSFKVASIYGYYYELDYGARNGLIDSLVYVQLYDIPDLKDLKRKGTISVGLTDGTGYPCVFSYTLSQPIFRDKEDVFG